MTYFFLVMILFVTVANTALTLLMMSCNFNQYEKIYNLAKLLCKEIENYLK